MKCTLKRPIISRTSPKASLSPESRRLLSRPTRRARTSKWWLRASEEEDIALFMKKFKKYIKKKKFSKGDKKLKSTTKITCYNCGKHDHFIAKCSFERRDDDYD
jgi:hypothetical protein